MFNRLKALLWLRNQMFINNKNYLIQVLMPYGLLVLYKEFMDIGESTGLGLMFICLSTAIAMSIGNIVSTTIAEEKGKNNLKTLLLSGVRPIEYLISVLVHPILITIVDMILFPIIGDTDLSDMYLEYGLVIMLTSVVVILINLFIAAISATQSKAQINGFPLMLFVSMGPALAQANPDVANFIQYTFIGAYTELFTKPDYSLNSQSFQVLFMWILGMIVISSLALKFNKNSKVKNELFKLHKIEKMEEKNA